MARRWITACLLLLPLFLLAVHLVPSEVADAAAFWPGRAFRWTLPLHLLASLVWMVLVLAVQHGWLTPSFGAALLLALLLRGITLPLSPALSDDLWRYLHEGQMVLAGQNPYATAPADVDPAGLAGRYWQDRDDPHGFHQLVRGDHGPRINHAEVPAAYPPMHQYALALGVLLHPGPMGMKLLFGIVDLLLFAALWGWLRALGRNPALAVVHGWCPLAAVETAGEGHADSLAALLLVLALWAWSRRRTAVAGAVLAAATAVKFLPVAVLPFLLRGNGRGAAARLAVAFAATALLLWLPFLGAGLALWDGLGLYAVSWRANDGAFALLLWAVEALQGLGLCPRGDPARWARVPMLLLFGAAMLVCWRARAAPALAALVAMTAFVALSPTVHPWYLLLWLPFVALRVEVGWLLFAGTVYLAYHVLPDWLAAGRWQEVGWVDALEWAPFWVGCWMAWRRGDPASATRGVPDSAAG